MPALGDGEARVFQGMLRTLIVKGFDKIYAPAQIGDLRRRVLAPEADSADPSGVFRAGQSGVAAMRPRPLAWTAPRPKESGHSRPCRSPT